MSAYLARDTECCAQCRYYKYDPRPHRIVNETSLSRSCYN